MDYTQSRAYMQEIGKAGSTYGLSGIRNLMEKLGNVQDKLKCIHVAGTNGKGSVCLMLSEILQRAGYRTGRYSSPAVFFHEEIFQVNGQPISKAQYAGYVTKCRDACERIKQEGKPQPSAFEIETAIAFCFFYDMQCDYAVIETGLGGIDDATNIIRQPVCSVVTSISRDHMALLGNTLYEIASAKAGIIKPGCPAVSAAQPEEAACPVKEKAAQCKSRLILSDSSEIENFKMDLPKGSSFSYNGEHYVTATAGAFQKENLICVLNVVKILTEKGISIPMGAVKSAFAEAKLPGRMECVLTEPEVYLDGAHNESAARYLRDTVEQCFYGRRLIYLMGVLADKEYKKVLELMLPLASEIYMVTPDNPRALPAEQLAAAASGLFPEKTVKVCLDFREAAQKVIQAAGTDGVVLAFGSLSFLGQLKQIWRPV